ncbi:amidohydrolase family protein [Microbacterium sp. ASV81]|uniref:Amidohydrolase family protein n=1 Tax=Microbacterium capsulatum TaxID=3041921 RepID=A0ABU0XIW3_9MICO|nr:amidohydrolase family protein [Microbacterium sp. ASV81]MDQ4215079.1 amidohydrolase family protein [Microbacterium sp. ASV81]
MTATASAPLLRTPGLVDAHIHPDKSSWTLPWLSRDPAGTLSELIENDRAVQAGYAVSVEERAHALLSRALAHGTLAMRAHVDVSSELGTANVEGVRAAAERLPDLTVQIVAFPQFGLLTNPGTLDAMAAALESGADLVGGIDPGGLEGDLHGHLDAVFGLADRAGRDIDIHLHDGGEDGLAQIREIARRTIAGGRQGRVTIGHAFALGDAMLPSLGATLDLVAEAGVWITTCALGADPIPDLDRLERHGVRVALGSDGVRDSWTPFGTGSMLDRAHLLAYRTDARTDAELERAFRIATVHGGELLGRPEIADWTSESETRLEFAAESLAQLVVDRPAPQRVLVGGREVAAR